MVIINHVQLLPDGIQTAPHDYKYHLHYDVTYVTLVTSLLTLLIVFAPELVGRWA